MRLHLGLTLGLLTLSLTACATSKTPPPAEDPAAMPHSEKTHAHPEGHSDMTGLGEANPHGEGHGPLVHRFTEPEAYAERWDSPEREAWQRPLEIVQAMDILPGLTVADIGTGTGYFLPLLSAAVGDGGKVLALDIEESMVQYVRERAVEEGLTPVDARVVAMDDPQLPAGEVDRVLIVNTWHHIPGRVEYLGKIAQGLAPGGSLYIVDFNVESSHGPPKHHRMGPEVVISELEAAGMDGSLLELDLPEQYVVKGTLPPTP